MSRLRDDAGTSGRLPRSLTVLMVVTVLGQRLALPVPGFQLQLTLVAGLATFALLLLHQRVRPDPLRMQLFTLAAVACALVAFLSTWSGGPLSVPSLLVLLALWLPWSYRLRDRSPEGYRQLALTFVHLMVALAAVGVLQLLAQALGVWSYRDLLGTLVPPAFLVEGYNVSIPLQYGASIHKSNAFVFLEPSFLSQFCALAAVVGVVLRAPVWQLLVLGLGVLSAVSGTGLFLLAFAFALTVVRAPGLLRPRLVAAGLAGLVVALLTPLSDLLLARSGEIGQTGSSGYKRFVAPYLEVGEGLTQDPLRYLIGAGPGTATRLLESSARGQAGDAVVYNIPAKLVFEYGFVAGTLFLVFIVVALLHRGPAPVIPGSVLFMIFLLSGSLLQPHTVVIAWLLTSLWTGVPRYGSDAGPPSAERERRPAVPSAGSAGSGRGTG